MRPSSFCRHFHYLSQNENRFWVHLVFFSFSLNPKQNYTEVLLLFQPCHNYQKGSECFYDSIGVLVKHQHNGIKLSSSSPCSLIYEKIVEQSCFISHSLKYLKWRPYQYKFQHFPNHMDYIWKKVYSSPMGARRVLPHTLLFFFGSGRLNLRKRNPPESSLLFKLTKIERKPRANPCYVSTKNPTTQIKSVFSSFSTP